MLTTLLAFLACLGVLVFVHELGHFLAAKWARIWVHRFSIGVGSPVKALSFRRGETEYAISWLPLGGYVKMASREEEATSSALEGETPDVVVPPDRMYEAAPIWKRMVVILAGVTMNILFAWAVYSGLALRNGRPVNPVTQVGRVDSTLLPPQAEPFRALRVHDRIVAVNGRFVSSWTDVEQELRTAPGDRLELALGDGRRLVAPIHADAVEARAAVAAAIEPFTAPVTGPVVPGRPAARAGMQPGDTILRVNGQWVDQWDALLSAIEGSPGRPLSLEIARGGQRVFLTVTPDSTEVRDSAGTRWVGKIGVNVFRGTRYEPYPSVWAALGAGGESTAFAATSIVRTVRGLLSGRVSGKALGGPIAIGQMAGETVRLGFEAFLAFTAFISVNLAVLNLLPIPVLDGGQFLFLVAEAVRRKPLPVALRERLTLVGLALIVALMGLAFWNDLRRLFESLTR